MGSTLVSVERKVPTQSCGSSVGEQSHARGGEGVGKMVTRQKCVGGIANGGSSMGEV